MEPDRQLLPGPEETQENGLIKSGRLVEFNSQFYNTMERGLFWKLSI
jgi:hypothetical protein